MNHRPRGKAKVFALDRNAIGDGDRVRGWRLDRHDGLGQAQHVYALESQAGVRDAVGGVFFVDDVVPGCFQQGPHFLKRQAPPQLSHGQLLGEGHHARNLW